MRLGIIVRADKTGLANQTRNLTYMLKPSKVLVIDSTPFNKNTQYFDTYSGFNKFLVNGFPTRHQVKVFLRDLDALLTCETFYNFDFITEAKSRGIKTYNQFNYEFLDNLKHPTLPLPTKLLSPSYWMLEESQKKFDNVEYLPPPTDARLFSESRNKNFKRSGKRFLHILGIPAMHDRNGTLDLIKALKLTRSEFELVIKTQRELGFKINDRRVTIDYNSPSDEALLYSDFDAVILPRRYAGLCLVMNEALMSGLPVIMTDISPNNKILPAKWLVQSAPKGQFFTRTMIPYFTVNHVELARKIDWLCKTDLGPEKAEALDIGYNNYSVEILKPQYEKILEL